jgi:hypothetical protein
VTDAGANKGVLTDQKGWDLLDWNLVDWEKLFLMQCTDAYGLSAAFVCCGSLEVGRLRDERRRSLSPRSTPSEKAIEPEACEFGSFAKAISELLDQI